MYKFYLFVINFLFSKSCSEYERKQMAMGATTGAISAILGTILVMSLMYWDNFDRVKNARLKNNNDIIIINKNETTEYFVRKTVGSNGLITLSTYYYPKSGMNTVHITESRSQFKAIDGQILWKIQRRVYDNSDRPIYRNEYIEGTPITQISGYYMEYDKNGRLIRKEQLLGLVIELDTGGRSFVKSVGTVIMPTSTE
jgi:hypothetical protein